METEHKLLYGDHADFGCIQDFENNAKIFIEQARTYFFYYVPQKTKITEERAELSAQYPKQQVRVLKTFSSKYFNQHNGQPIQAYTQMLETIPPAPLVLTNIGNTIEAMNELVKLFNKRILPNSALRGLALQHYERYVDLLNTLCDKATAYSAHQASLEGLHGTALVTGLNKLIDMAKDIKRTFNSFSEVKHERSVPHIVSPVTTPKAPSAAYAEYVFAQIYLAGIECIEQDMEMLEAYFNDKQNRKELADYAQANTKSKFSAKLFETSMRPFMKTFKTMMLKQVDTHHTRKSKLLAQISTFQTDHNAHITYMQSLDKRVEPPAKP